MTAYHGPGGNGPDTNPGSNEPAWLDRADRTSPWQELSVVVAGLDVEGYSAAAALLTVGARVLVVDEAGGEEVDRRATILETLSAQVRIGSEAVEELTETVLRSDPVPHDLVVTSSDWSPDAPLLRAAVGRGVPVLGEVDLAARLADPARPTPWLVVAGHHHAAELAAYMLRAAGLRTAPVGAGGVPVSDVVLDPEPYDALVVGLSDRHLHWCRSLRPRASAVLDVAGGPGPETLAWHGSEAAYRAALGKAYADCELACVYQAADEAAEELVREADVMEGARAIGLTHGVPGVGMLGVVENVLADRAFIAERAKAAAELATLADIPAAGGDDLLDDVLAASALARAQGAPPAAIRTGLADFGAAG